MFEHRAQPLISKANFLRRLGIAFLLTLALIGVSVIAGSVGYRIFAGFEWSDAFHQSCLVLGENSGEHPENTAGKVFNGIYVMYARLVFFSVVAMLMLPILHRILHKLHLDIPIDDLDGS